MGGTHRLTPHSFERYPRPVKQDPVSVLAAAALVPLAAFAGCWRPATSIERDRDDSRGVVMIRSKDFRDDDLWSLLEASASAICRR